MHESFELADGCEDIHTAPGIRIFRDPTGVMRAVFNVDRNEDPLPQCDPNRFGYALTAQNFIDINEGIAICEVVHLETFLAGIQGWEAEVVANL